uniref:Si:dkey-52j6.3 n=1 Tax=Hucho hucho TaxID=62062 RepID=A0A4W5NYM7_9TELE
MRFLPAPSVQSLRLLFLFIFVMGVAPSPALTAGCPDRCVCDDQLVVQCAGQELTLFPNDLPLATRQLIISNNRIGELPALQLNYLSDLVYMDFSNNTLTEISESTFGNLRKLAYLDLSFNTLTQIEDRTFGPLSSLVMLRLTDNPGLSEIHPDAFSENMALQVLDVSRNNLTTLNISSLIALPSLRSMGLSGNPWRCDCETEDLFSMIRGLQQPTHRLSLAHSPTFLYHSLSLLSPSLTLLSLFLTPSPPHSFPLSLTSTCPSHHTNDSPKTLQICRRFHSQCLLNFHIIYAKSRTERRPTTTSSLLLSVSLLSE